MPAHISSMKEKACNMIAAGRSTREICDATGLAGATVCKYRRQMYGLPSATIQDGSYKMRPGFCREWTLAVNRIRRYYGMKPFRMPEEE